MMEILSPAGNMQALERAVAAGCGAVYLGCSAFSARAGAGNFDMEELRQALRLCHLHGVRVHVAVNTLVKDGELDEVLRLLRELDAMRVDAVLVQDLGILRLTRRCVPDLPVHASTQMAIHNQSGAAWCRRMGMTRAVLARECSLAEIRRAAASGIEIEVFGHGAQCVSVSGECLFSSMLGERSGNRGRCAQPCRLPYRFRGQEGAWLSPRDVCLRNDLPELAGAGAVSVKLEGRLKRPEYVATVTRSYARAAADLKAGRFARADSAEWEGLLQAFQRGGFMRGYAMGCEDAGVIAPERVDHGGVAIGVVGAVRGSLAEARLTRTLHDGDQLRLSGPGGDYEMIYAGGEIQPGQRASLRLRPDAAVRPGDAVVRLTDSAQLAAANALPMPRIPFAAALTAMPGQPLRLRVQAGAVSVTVTGAPPETAQLRALTEQAASESLAKTGGTPFELADCRVETENAFVPVSALNALRREALERLTDALADRFARKPGSQLEPDECVLPVGAQPDTVIFRKPGQLGGLPDGARLVWYPEDFRPEALERGLAALPSGVWLQLPTVCEEATLAMLREVTDRHRDRLAGVVLGSVGQLGVSWTLPVAAGSGVPVMNRRAAQLLFEAGCEFVTASPELSGTELRTLLAGSPPILVPSYGRAQLMLLHHCPARCALGLKSGHAACAMCDEGRPESLRGEHLTDRRGTDFPLLRQRLPEGCLVRLMNSLPTDIRQRVRQAGWPMLLELTDEGGLPGENIPATRGHWARPVL